jgi:chemotaxis protein MotB
MASTDNEVPAPIIIKKVKKGGHGHHGGAWKVAYADFVTAMMAFFLLMWLLNVTTQEEKNAIANYFDPTHPKVSQSESGSGGILGGITVTFEGAMTSDRQPPTTPPDATTPNTGSALGDQQLRQGSEGDQGAEGFEIKGSKADDSNDSMEDAEADGFNILDEVQRVEEAEIEELRQQLEQQQNETFEGIKQKIYEELEKTPELADLKDNLMIDITPEGLRIQIVDDQGRSMFPSGQAVMYDFMRELVEKVTQVIAPQPNQISMRGHTDGVQYPAGAAYDNWNLSADRALATRSVMLQSGLPAPRIENVVGKADREHLFPDEPLSPRNRRISVILLREKLLTDEQVRAAAEKAGINVQKEEREQEQTPQGEDRENIPELDQTIERSEPVNVGEPENDTSDTTIADELRKLQERRDARPNTVTPAQENNEESNDFLEF